MEMGFQCFIYFLTATFYFVMLNNLLIHIRTTTVYYLYLLILMDD